MEQNLAEPKGLRERKRRETLRRITEAGFKLFIDNGYEATTLDAIAEASGISRRTFFYYFTSKEEIVFAWQDGLADRLRAFVLADPEHSSPMEMARHALSQLLAHYDADQGMAINRLLHSTEQLRKGYYAKYLLQEQALFEALGERWPDPGLRGTLRLVAMVCIGAMRIAIDQWADSGGKQPINTYLQRALADLKVEVRS